MKLQLDMLSVGIGAAIGLGIGVLPMAPLGFLDYSWSNVGVALSAGPGLLLAAVAMWRSRPAPKAAFHERARERLSQYFPTVAPAWVDWSIFEGTLSPAAWLRRHPDVQGALEQQVVMPVPEAIFQCLVAALRVAASSGGPDRLWGVEELARRAWEAYRTANRLDADDFLKALRARFTVPGPAPMSSPFHSVQVIELLAEVRKSCILPASRFLWVKLYDWRLWYAIDNLGRSTHHVEGLGPIAHYEMQMRSAGSIDRVDVSLAIEALASLTLDVLSSLEPSPVVGR